MSSKGNAGTFARGMRGYPLLILFSALMSGCAGAPEVAPVGPSGLSEWEGEPTVLTRYGYARGSQGEDGTWLWRALPFASPPVGELRWRAPREPQPWSGVRSSRRFASACTQFRPLLGRCIVGSEDCLYLNIWRPRTAERHLPVYVWIHGGGNSIGSATYVPDYYGHRLASAGNLVFVSVNYRLGPFGWFSHPALREGISAEDDSGNYGTLDLIQALRWVQGNITAFGGDPGTVTIAGESAGAMNVLSLLVSPMATGLFQRAVIESGAPTAQTPAEGEERATRLLEDLLVRDRKARSQAEAQGLLGSMSPQEIRAYLRCKSDRQLLRGYRPGRAGMVDNPNILSDGAVIPADGFGTLASGEYASKVPVLIGSNLEELKLFLFLQGSLPWRGELYQAVVRYGSQMWKASGVDGVARSLAARPRQPPVYAYLFAWGAPDEKGRSPLPGHWGARLGAFHSLEVPFFLGTDTINGALFSTFLFTTGNRGSRKALTAAMMDYLVSFLRSGDPNRAGSGLPVWRPWSNEDGAPKSLLLDSREGKPYLQMLDSELTLQGIYQTMQAELTPELLEKTKRELVRTRLNLTGPGE
jgi:para-nitrobenzyl esterase